MLTDYVAVSKFLFLELWKADMRFMLSNSHRLFREYVTPQKKIYITSEWEFLKDILILFKQKKNIYLPNIIACDYIHYKVKFDLDNPPQILKQGLWNIADVLKETKTVEKIKTETDLKAHQVINFDKEEYHLKTLTNHFKQHQNNSTKRTYVLINLEN